MRRQDVSSVLSMGLSVGEGNGPLDPTPRPAGVVLAGANPLAVDLASARLMDFDLSVSSPAQPGSGSTPFVSCHVLV